MSDDDMPEGEEPVSEVEMRAAEAHARAVDAGSGASAAREAGAGGSAGSASTAGPAAASHELLAADLMRAAATPPPLDPEAASRIRRELVARASHRAGLRGRVRAFFDRMGPGWILVPALATMLIFLGMGDGAIREGSHAERLGRVAEARAASPPAGRPFRIAAARSKRPRILEIVARRRAAASGKSTTGVDVSPARPAPPSTGPGRGLALAMLALHGRE